MIKYARTNIHKVIIAGWTSFFLPTEKIFVIIAVCLYDEKKLCPSASAFNISTEIQTFRLIRFGIFNNPAYQDFFYTPPISF